MAPPPFSWCLRLVVVCHLTMLLAGQHHGVKKCSIKCSRMTPEISVDRLISYRRNQASCSKPAIIFTTIRNRSICADPEAEWVQKAMRHLDSNAAYGTYEKLVKPRTGVTDSSAITEPKTTGESSPQETPRTLGTSPELPTTAADPCRPTCPTASKPLDGQPPAGPETTKLYNSAAVATTTTTSRQGSAAYQRGILGTARKPSEVASTQAPTAQAPSTQTLPTQAPSTQVHSTRAPSTQTLTTQAPSTQTPSTQAPSTQTLTTQAPSTQAPSTQTLTTQAPSTQAPSSHALSSQATPTQTPIISHTAPASSTGSSPQPKEMSPTSNVTDAFTGPSGISPASPTGTLSWKSVIAGSWAPTETDPTSLATTRRQAVGLLAFLGLLFCLGVAMFAYQSLQACHVAGDMVDGLRYVPRNCGSNSYVLVPV